MGTNATYACLTKDGQEVSVRADISTPCINIARLARHRHGKPIALVLGEEMINAKELSPEDKRSLYKEIAENACILKSFKSSIDDMCDNIPVDSQDPLGDEFLVRTPSVFDDQPTGQTVGEVAMAIRQHAKPLEARPVCIPSVPMPKDDDLDGEIDSLSLESEIEEQEDFEEQEELVKHASPDEANRLRLTLAKALSKESVVSVSLRDLKGLTIKIAEEPAVSKPADESHEDEETHNDEETPIKAPEAPSGSMDVAKLVAMKSYKHMGRNRTEMETRNDKEIVWLVVTLKDGGMSWEKVERALGLSKARGKTAWHIYKRAKLDA